MPRASDFWITDRHRDIELGGMSLTVQKQLLAEVEAARAREKELEAKLAEPATPWSLELVHRICEAASAELPHAVTIVNRRALGTEIDRAIRIALDREGLIGDHPSLRTAAKLRLVRLREDFRAAPRPQLNHHAEGDRS